MLETLWGVTPVGELGSIRVGRQVGAFYDGTCYILSSVLSIYLMQSPKLLPMGTVLHVLQTGSLKLREVKQLVCVSTAKRC